MTLQPDTKDWTWVLERPCPECGYDATALDRSALPDLFRDTAERWERALGNPDVGVRPTARVWSPLEYACHVRDVHRMFDGRVVRMLDEEAPDFVNWDQDAEAVENRYGEQDPTGVGQALREASDAVGRRYGGLADEQWDRTGRSSGGFVFTVDSLARYHLHDVLHHLYDIRG